MNTFNPASAVVVNRMISKVVSRTLEPSLGLVVTSSVTPCDRFHNAFGEPLADVEGGCKQSDTPSGTFRLVRPP